MKSQVFHFFWRMNRYFQRQLLRNRVRLEVVTGSFSWEKYTQELSNSPRSED
jgi:hypothetical protein